MQLKPLALIQVFYQYEFSPNRSIKFCRPQRENSQGSDRREHQAMTANAVVVLPGSPNLTNTLE
jgi:hypothetical protein